MGMTWFVTTNPIQTRRKNTTTSVSSFLGLLLMFFLLFFTVIIHAEDENNNNNNDNNENNDSIENTTTTTTEKNNNQNNNLLLSCEPCLNRSFYTLRVISHGTFQNPIWRRSITSMEQAAYDFNIQLQWNLYNDSNDNSNTTMTSSNNNTTTIDDETTTTKTLSSHYWDYMNEYMIQNIIDAMKDDTVDGILVTIPNEIIQQKITELLLSGTEENTTSVVVSTNKPLFGWDVGVTQSYQPLNLRYYVGPNDTHTGVMAANEFIQYYTNNNGNNNNDTTDEDNSQTTPPSTTRIALRAAVFVDSVLEPSYASSLQRSAFIQTLQDYARAATTTTTTNTIDDDNDNTNTNNNNNILSRVSNILVSQLQVNPLDFMEHVRLINLLFVNGSCPYQAIVVNSITSVPIVIEAIQTNHCETRTKIGVILGTGPTSVLTNGNSNSSSSTNTDDDNTMKHVYDTLIRYDEVLFMLDQQMYLQSAMSVLLAATDITTHQTKHIQPMPDTTTSTTTNNANNNEGSDSDVGYFVSGPVLLNRNNIPSDSIQACQDVAFPICNSPVSFITTTTTSDEAEEEEDDETTTTTSSSSSCQCIDRSLMKLGAVVHGVKTDAFWDPLVASAKQAALDMGGITLDFERFDPIPSTENFTFIENKMAARIEALCTLGNINGLITTIPVSSSSSEDNNNNSTIVNSIRICQNLGIPIVSINTGFETANTLKLLHHVSQREFVTGVEAGKRLIDAGMKFGYCLDHEYGNEALTERCQGFEYAIQEYNRNSKNSSSSSSSSDLVQYMGHIPVPHDSESKYKSDVNEAVLSSSAFIDMDIDIDSDWDGIGFLLNGVSQLGSIKNVIADHPKVIVGTFDVNSDLFDSLNDGILQFGIDQQPYFQGNIPVYLLTYFAYTNERFLNFNIDSGPKFVTEPPSLEEITCEMNDYEFCLGPNHNNNNEPITSPTTPEQNSGSTTTTTTTTTTTLVSIPPLLSLDCDPCVERSKFTIEAILHGNSDDEFWQQGLSSMKQAALDMNIQLIVHIASTSENIEIDMSQQIQKAMFDPNVDGIITSIPNESVYETIVELSQQQRKPIFGMNAGYHYAQQLNLQGHIGQNDIRIGEAGAMEFLKYYEVQSADNNSNNETTNSTTTTSIMDATADAANKIYTLKSAVYVASTSQLEISNQFQFDGFRDTLQQVLRGGGSDIDGNSIVVVDKVMIDPLDTIAHEESIRALFRDCPYQAIYLTWEGSITFAVVAKEENQCSNTQIGIAQVSNRIYKQITLENLLFAIDQFIYLQGALSVILASVYVTTGKKLSLPLEEQAYITGPHVVTVNNVPSDTLQTCAAEAFPICNGYVDDVLKSEKCACIDRSVISIGGVLHGDTTDSFWDPVFASAEQASRDMGIKLDLFRFSPNEDPEILQQQMGARIRSLCEGGIDGIFVSIPSDLVNESIELCRTLDVPVISINAGEETSAKLGLYHHIAQVEYTAGFGAGDLLIKAGMKHGYCPDHAVGNPATAARCSGFEDAIKATNGEVTYHGTFRVPKDNRLEYKIEVENFVGQTGDWDGIGILILGPDQLEGLKDVVAEHPKLISGTFDVSTDITKGIEEGWLQFGIDQQPFVQGNLPVYLLTFLAYTQQALSNQKIESGPSFLITPPTPEEATCELNGFTVCVPRPEENMNFIPAGLLSFGYAMFGIISLMCLGTGIWTFIHRNEWVVKVSQPSLLGMVIIGCFISSLSIIFIGVQTEYPQEQNSATAEPNGPRNPDIGLADASCMAVPWLYGMGFVIAFSALFAKIQRIKLIYAAGLRMQRKTIGLKDVAYIMAILLIAELGILTSWQIMAPLKWNRIVLDSLDGFPLESVGGCTYDDSWIFFVILVGFHVVCLFYALALCFQTKDINSDFAESSYISLTVAFMFQVLVLAVPISALVRDTANVFYFIRVCAIFLQNFTAISLLFVPKIIRHHYPPLETGGSTGGGGGFHLAKSKSRCYQTDGQDRFSRHISGMEQEELKRMSLEEQLGMSSSLGRLSLTTSSAVEEHRPSRQIRLSEVANIKEKLDDDSNRSITILVNDRLDEVTSISQKQKQDPLNETVDTDPVRESNNENEKKYLTDTLKDLLHDIGDSSDDDLYGDYHEHDDPIKKNVTKPSDFDTASDDDYDESDEVVQSLPGSRSLLQIIPSEITSNWDVLGFQSQDDANKFVTALRTLDPPPPLTSNAKF